MDEWVYCKTSASSCSGWRGVGRTVARGICGDGGACADVDADAGVERPGDCIVDMLPEC